MTSQKILLSLQSFLLLSFIAGCVSCAHVCSNEQVKFDLNKYQAEASKNVLVELFTSGTSVANDSMPQEPTTSFTGNGFPIVSRSPVVYAMITNFQNQPLRLWESELRDSLFAINRFGYVSPEFSSQPLREDSEIVIEPGETYTHRTNLPPISGKKGVYWLRMSGFYTEPLRVRYAD